jgi:hypothetical protein
VSGSHIREHLARLFPGWRLVATEPLGADKDKAIGYGVPAKLTLVDAANAEHTLVWRVGAANELGHDRRSDRSANALLAFDDFARIPQHIRALDVGAIGNDGELVSLRDCGELYLITSYAPGTVYAEDLRRIARERHARDQDIMRVDALATYLAGLHVPIDDPPRYRRAIRDLVGSGEGIFGVADGYPADLRDRVNAIELRCVEWRWRLRESAQRLVRTHGDFHPFNIVFDGDTFACLDASRGTCGDPADDVTALAVNYLLFAIEQRDAWARGFGPLWHRLWQTYAAKRSDPQLLAVSPPFFAWRTLVVASPRFYPNLEDRARRALLDFARDQLDAGALDPHAADRMFA